MIDIDLSRWPVVIAQDGSAPDAEAVAMFASKFEELFESGERFAVVFDMLPAAASGVTALHAWTRENRERLGNQCAGIAIVFKPLVLSASRRILAERAAKLPFRLAASACIHDAIARAEEFLENPATTQAV